MKVIRAHVTICGVHTANNSAVNQPHPKGKRIVRAITINTVHRVRGQRMKPFTMHRWYLAHQTTFDHTHLYELRNNANSTFSILINLRENWRHQKLFKPSIKTFRNMRQPATIRVWTTIFVIWVWARYLTRARECVIWHELWPCLHVRILQKSCEWAIMRAPHTLTFTQNRSETVLQTPRVAKAGNIQLESQTWPGIDSTVWLIFAIMRGTHTRAL